MRSSGEIEMMATPPASLPATEAQLRRERLRRRGRAAIPWLLFLLALLPRVWSPLGVPIGTPEVEDLYRASRLLDHDGAGLLGVPPLVAAQALTRAAGLDAGAWVVLLGFVDALTAPLLFLAGRQLADRGVGVMAAMLYAASPWAWLWGRTPAARELGVVAAFVCLALLSPGQRLRWVVLGASAAAIVSLDSRAWPVILAIGISAVLARPSTRALGVGLAAGIVVSIPLIWGVASGRRSNAMMLDDTREPFVWPLDTLAGIGVDRFAPPWVLPSSPLAEGQIVATVVAVILVVLGVARAVRDAARGDPRGIGLVLLLVAGWWPMFDVPEVRRQSLVIALAPTVLLIAWGARVDRQIIGGLPARVAAYAAAGLALVWFATLATLIEPGPSPGAARAAPTLRELVETVRISVEAVDRLGADGVVIDVSNATPEASQLSRLALPALFPPRVKTRESRHPLLPLRTPIVSVQIYFARPVAALAWPSMIFGDVRLIGVGTARVAAQVPRGVDEWLTDVPAVQPRTFADGSQFLGWRARSPSEVETYWRLGTNPRVVANRIALGGSAESCGANTRPLPPLEYRHADEITVVVVPAAGEPRVALLTPVAECLPPLDR